MALKSDYNDNNGYGDFKRNSQSEGTHDGEDGVKLNEKADEYMRELLSEKIKLDQSKFPVSLKLLDSEVTRVQSTGRLPPRDNKYLDLYNDKPIKLSAKVLVPIREFPKFNFIGKLLGPKGNTLKQLQDDTMCKMAILGRGSMRDRNKEEELRTSLDPKFAHLTDDLHIEIFAFAPPAEAYARITYALAEVRKYLIPDPTDMMRPPMPGHMRGPPMDRSAPRMAPRAAPPPPRISGRALLPQGPRSVSTHKPKAMSILDRARNAMDSYSYDEYEQREPPPVRRAEPDYYTYDRSHDNYYEEDNYYKEEPSRDYGKPSRDVGTRRMPPSRGTGHFSRNTPYSRPAKDGSKKSSNH